MSFQLPAQLKTAWDKLKALFVTVEHAAAVIFTAEEQRVLTAVSPLLHAAEAGTLSSLHDFIRNVLITTATSNDLPTWEAKVLNELQAEGGQLFTIARGMGSNLLQATIGVLLHDLPKAPAQ